MKPTLAAALYGTCLLLAFGAGWFFKPAASPVPATGPIPTALHDKRPGSPVPQKPVTAAVASEENWLDAAAADVAAIRAAKQPGVVNQVLIDKLEVALNIKDQNKRLALFQRLVLEMRPADAFAIQALFKDRAKDLRISDREYEIFVKQWGLIAGSVAVEVLSPDEENLSWFKPLLDGWVQQDEDAAIQWLHRQPSGDFLFGYAFSGVFDGLFQMDQVKAERFLESHADNRGLKNDLGKPAWYRIQQDGWNSASQWFAGVATGDASDAYKTANLTTLLGSAMKGSFQPLDQAGVELLLPYHAEAWFPDEAGQKMGEHWALTDPAAGLALITEMQSPGAKTAAIDRLTGAWAAADPNALGVWLGGNLSHPAYDRAAYHLARKLIATDPEAAEAWADQIKEPALRSAANAPAPQDPFAAGE